MSRTSSRVVPSSIDVTTLDAASFAAVRATALAAADSTVSLAAYDQYCREVKWLSLLPLTQVQEAMLLDVARLGYLERSRACPDQAVLDAAQVARNRLVEAYQPVILELARARACWFRSMEVLDLVNEASLGLLSRFDYYFQGVFVGPFRVFVMTVVTRWLAAARSDRDALLTLPCRVKQLLGWKRRAEKELRASLGRVPELSELAVHLGVSEDELQRACEASRACYAESLEGLLREDEQEDRHEFMSLFGPCLQEEFSEQTVLAVALRRACEKVLTAKQYEAVRLRYRLDDGGSCVRTHQEVACLLGLSDQGGACDLDHAALARLRAALVLVRVQGRQHCELLPVYQQESYTLKQAAAVLGMSGVSLLRRVRAGAVPAARRRDVSGQLAWVFDKRVIDELAASGRLALVSAEKPQDCYTVEQVAQRLGVSTGTVRAWARCGLLPARRHVWAARGIWVFPCAAIDALVASGSLAIAS